MKRKTKAPLAFATVSAVMLAFCASLCAAEIDDQIDAAFRHTYAYKSYLKNDMIHAAIHDGVVTLTGTVVEESHKTLAQATVANMAGVTRVNNQLLVEKAETAVGPDELIARNVKLTLQFHRHVNSAKTVVEVQDGVVTLHGEASGAAQKQLVTEFVADVAGVNGVQNEMTVATPVEPAVQATNNETLDDASVTAQIVTMLMTHRSTSTVLTRVSTRNGVVTLTGITKNEAQNALIVKIVTNIRGVTSVINQMTIENEPRSN